jgi:hypothetical protein
MGDMGMDEARTKPVETITIMGRPVSKEAWERFKAGDLPLARQPEVGFATDSRDPGMAPTFKTKTSELAFKLGALAKSAADDSMANFLSFVADALVHERDPENRQKLRRIGLHALRVAGMPMGEGIALNSPVIKEFNEWLATYAPEAVLLREAEIEEGPQFNGYKRVASAHVRGAPPTTASPAPVPAAPAAPVAAAPGGLLQDEEDLDEKEVAEDVRLGSPATITFESNLSGTPVSVTVTSHPAVAGDDPVNPMQSGGDQPANLSFDNIITSEGQRIDPKSLDPATQQQLQEQAFRELYKRTGDDNFSESVELAEDEWSPLLDERHLTFAKQFGEALMAPMQNDQQTRVGAPGLNHGDMENEALMSMPQSGVNTEVGAGGEIDMGDNSVPTEVEFGGCGDPNALTPDDVILPTNMGRDLEGEVRKKTTRDIDGNEIAVDPAYISRLTQLAGMNRY